MKEGLTTLLVLTDSSMHNEAPLPGFPEYFHGTYLLDSASILVSLFQTF